TRRRRADGESINRRRAVTKLQWSRRANATETVHDGAPFTLGGFGFNGAVARTRRRRPPLSKRRQSDSVASMEPSRERDGDPPLRVLPRARSGPASMEPSRERDGDWYAF